MVCQGDFGGSIIPVNGGRRAGAWRFNMALREERSREAMSKKVTVPENESALTELAKETGLALKRAGLVAAVAESCTGGLVGHLMTEVPGSSDWFLGSAGVYSYAAKEKVLGVDGALLVREGRGQWGGGGADGERRAGGVRCGRGGVDHGHRGPGRDGGETDGVGLSAPSGAGRRRAGGKRGLAGGPTREQTVERGVRAGDAAFLR